MKLFSMTIPVYIPSERRAVQIEIGLLHRARLRLFGEVVSHIEESSGHLYAIVKCKNCKCYYLSGDTQDQCPFEPQDMLFQQKEGC